MLICVKHLENRITWYLEKNVLLPLPLKGLTVVQWPEHIREVNTTGYLAQWVVSYSARQLWHSNKLRSETIHQQWPERGLSTHPISQGDWQPVKILQWNMMFCSGGHQKWPSLDVTRSSFTAVGHQSSTLDSVLASRKPHAVWKPDRFWDAARSWKVVCIRLWQPSGTFDGM